MWKVVWRMIPWRFTPAGIAHRAVVAGTRLTVASGPFAGLKYVPKAHGSCLPPKLIGIYERELHSVFAALRTAPVDVLIDVGAAEGYYAVGMVVAGLAGHSIAFEADPNGIALLRDLAARNGVTDRVTIKGWCSPADLQQELTVHVGRRILLIVDVEGAEDNLLDPTEVPATRTTEILVELHDFLVPGVTDRIRQRFAPTHNITRFEQTPRTEADNPYRSWLVRRLSARDRADVVSEKRTGQMHWFWMQPKGEIL